MEVAFLYIYLCIGNNNRLIILIPDNRFLDAVIKRFLRLSKIA